jgi:hypothetical protein
VRGGLEVASAGLDVMKSPVAIRCMIGETSRAWETNMKPRHPNVEWIKNVLADLERDRGNPQIAALMDRGMDELAVTAPEPVCGLQPAHEPFEDFTRASTVDPAVAADARKCAES